VNFAGLACERCAEGRAGKECVKSGDGSGSVGVVVGVIIAVVVLIVATIGGVVWYKKKRIPQRRYQIVSKLGLIEDEQL